MAAQILSQISSSFIIHYHRQVVSNALAAITELCHEQTEQIESQAFTSAPVHVFQPQPASASRDSSVSSKLEKGTIVATIPPMATSQCIDNEHSTKRDVAAMPESTEVQKVYTSDDMGDRIAHHHHLKTYP